MQAFVVALNNQNWEAAVAISEHVGLDEIERDLRVNDGDVSVLDGIMPCN